MFCWKKIYIFFNSLRLEPHSFIHTHTRTHVRTHTQVIARSQIHPAPKLLHRQPRWARHKVPGTNLFYLFSCFYLGLAPPCPILPDAAAPKKRKKKERKLSALRVYLLSRTLFFQVDFSLLPYCCFSAVTKHPVISLLRDFVQDQTVGIFWHTSCRHQPGVLALPARH